MDFDDSILPESWRPDTCPHCGGLRTAIWYGLPTVEARAVADCSLQRHHGAAQRHGLADQRRQVLTQEQPELLFGRRVGQVRQGEVEPLRGNGTVEQDGQVGGHGMSSATGTRTSNIDRPPWQCSRWPRVAKASPGLLNSGNTPGGAVAGWKTCP